MSASGRGEFSILYQAVRSLTLEPNVSRGKNFSKTATDLPGVTTGASELAHSQRGTLAEGHVVFITIPTCFVNQKKTTSRSYILPISRVLRSMPLLRSLPERRSSVSIVAYNFLRSHPDRRP